MVDSQRKLELSKNIANVKAAMATVPQHERVRKRGEKHIMSLTCHQSCHY